MQPLEQIQEKVLEKANEQNPDGLYTLSSVIPDNIPMPVIYEQEFGPQLPNPPFPTGYWEQDGLTFGMLADYIYNNQV